MELAIWLLFAIGVAGGTDIVLFHCTSHGLRSNPDSWLEEFTHFLRAPTYTTLFLLVPNFAMEGAWYWVLVAILVFDALVSVFDFAVEGNSRRFLGGLPAGEYVLHMVIAMVFGAFVLSVLQLASVAGNLPTRFAYAPFGVPDWLRATMAVMAALVAWSGYYDLKAFLRLKQLPPSGSSNAPQQN